MLHCCVTVLHCGVTLLHCVDIVLHSDVTVLHCCFRMLLCGVTALTGVKVLHCGVKGSTVEACNPVLSQCHMWCKSELL